MDLPRSLTSPRHLRLDALLREARIAAGMQQATLAARLGRKQAFVSKYENGTRSLDAVDFLAVVDLIGCDLAPTVEGVREAGRE